MDRVNDPVSDQARAGLDPSGFDPSRRHYRSQGFAMTTVDTGRDADGAPFPEAWAFATEDDYAHGYGWLDLRIHEVVETERSGTLVVYYKQWFAPDGEPAWGKRPRRCVGSLGSVKAIIARRKMTAIAMEAASAGETVGLDPKGDCAKVADVMAALRAALSEHEGKPCNCGAFQFGVGSYWPSGKFGKVTCFGCGAEQNVVTAQGIEARSDETRSGSAEGKSPVRKDAHNV